MVKGTDETGRKTAEGGVLLEVLSAALQWLEVDKKDIPVQLNQCQHKLTISTQK